MFSIRCEFKDGIGSIAYQSNVIPRVDEKIKCGNMVLLVTDVIYLTTESNLVTLIVRRIREC